jgi:isopenicillin N synthase-like dioxygenase
MKHNLSSIAMMTSMLVAWSVGTANNLYAMEIEREGNLGHTSISRVFTNEPLLQNQQVKPKLLQINIDDFDKETMTEILKKHGTFEVVGPSVDALSADFLEAMEECKMLFKHLSELPEESLKNIYHNLPLTSGEKVLFHGFQDVQKETRKKLEEQGIGEVRYQTGFHFKPYLPPRLPEGITELKAYAKYYEKGMVFLHRLYDIISEAFIKSENKSTFRETDQTSVLTSREYIPGDKRGGVGIIPHSDYGLLTLVASDKPGLQALEGENIKLGQWIDAPCGEPGKPRFHINVGDWLLFETEDKEFVAGVHQVPQVKEENRYSFSLFLNPHLDEVRSTFKDILVDYDKYLKSDKKDYHVNPRLY